MVVWNEKQVIARWHWSLKAKKFDVLNFDYAISKVAGFLGVRETLEFTIKKSKSESKSDKLVFLFAYVADEDSDTNPPFRDYDTTRMIYGEHKRNIMADKSAFVPVDAIANHKATDMDVDIDDELFGKKGASAPAAAAPPPPVKATTSPAAPKKFEYKKSSTYQKTYAKQ